MDGRGPEASDGDHKRPPAGLAVPVIEPEKDGEQERRAGELAGTPWEVFWVAFRLGLTSFGGPIAHLGYFHREYVVRRRWLDEETYADLVALAQFLPGAASSKVGMSIGILRAGPRGGLAAWIGFTLPSAVALATLGIALTTVDASAVDYLRGLKIVAVAVVAQAVWSMATKLAPDGPRATLAAAAAVTVLVAPTAFTQLIVIVLAAVVGWRFLASADESTTKPMVVPLPRWVGVSAWVLLVALLVGLPLLRYLVHDQTVALMDAFFRTGSLVFGGGHVVLPLLETEVVSPGWVDSDQFLAGYGLAQAVPGPLFTFAAFLGATSGPEPNGAPGAMIALVAIFLPSWLLTLGALPWWGKLRSFPATKAALRGVNAGVVGILLAALYDPVFTTAIIEPVDFAVALAAFVALQVWRAPPWVVVFATGLLGAVLVGAGR